MFDTNRLLITKSPASISAPEIFVANLNCSMTY
ncbi:hypothetical protein ACQ27_gp679 [Klebsiella phage K64-1]|nr:hypothetical protein ACQ27_gp679 [Klebsiella phage K64-1]